MDNSFAFAMKSSRPWPVLIQSMICDTVKIVGAYQSTGCSVLVPVLSWRTSPIVSSSLCAPSHWKQTHSFFTLSSAQIASGTFKPKYCPSKA